MRNNLLFYVIFAVQFFAVFSLSSRFNSRKDFGNDFEIEREYGSVSGVTSSPSSSSGKTVEFTDQCFKQKLDHSRPTDNSTWDQVRNHIKIPITSIQININFFLVKRYFVNEFYYEEGGPVFLFVFGESEAHTKWMGRGPQWTGYAKKLNALCFGLEHRFYGKSRPKE